MLVFLVLGVIVMLVMLVMLDMLGILCAVAARAVAAHPPTHRPVAHPIVPNPGPLENREFGVRIESFALRGQVAVALLPGLDEHLLLVIALVRDGAWWNIVKRCDRKMHRALLS